MTDDAGAGRAEDADVPAATAVEGATPADAGAADAAERGDAELERARDEFAALNDRHLRLAAEFDNYRKRTERERGEAWSRAQAELASALLDALDDLGRVAEIDASTASPSAVLDGVHLVERKLQRALAAAGLEEVDAADRPFDPSSMEALMTVEAEDAAQDDTVALVLQKGYRFKGQLLRPARVQVRKYDG